MKKRCPFIIITILIMFFCIRTNVKAEADSIVLDSRSDIVPTLSWTNAGNSNLYWNIVDFTPSYDGVLIFNFAYRPNAYIPTQVLLYGSSSYTCDISNSSSYTDSLQAITNVTVICPVNASESYYQVGFVGTYLNSGFFFLGRYGSITNIGYGGNSGSSTDYTIILNSINSNISNISNLMYQEWRWVVPGIYTNTNDIKNILNDYFDSASDTLSDINDNIESGNSQAHSDSQQIHNDITNDNISGAEDSADDLVDNSAFQDSTGLSSIISMPLTFINNLSNTCTPITLTIPYMDYTFSLPCLQTVIGQYMPALVIVLKVIVNGLIIYWVMLDIFKIVKNAKNPDDDRIEVLDL